MEDMICGGFDLNEFPTLSLEDIKSVSLQKRTDTKYLLNLSQLTALLSILKSNYSIVEIDSLKNLPYKTLYYDTPDLDLYRIHHNGKLNRYKFRTREYQVSNLRDDRT